MVDEIRNLLDVSPLEKTVLQLEQSLGYLDSEMASRDDGLRAQFRAASIQAFEYTYELGVKMLRRQLEQIVINPAELREMAFMELIRTGAEAGLIREVARFRVYREKRNITSHTYDEERAEEVLAILPDFIRDMRYLLDELKRRNDATARH
jgi:nucleotidyltransferase substrate binding protein (TIGR01987 family)